MKYKNRKTVVDGIKFDSAAEARRWQELCYMERAWAITDLQRQVTVELVPGVRLYGEKRARPAIRLVVDFVYMQDGILVHEDVKGIETPLSRAKRHMAKALLGIDVRVVK